jgi:hypothetical protein
MFHYCRLVWVKREEVQHLYSYFLLTLHLNFQQLYEIFLIFKKILQSFCKMIAPLNVDVASREESGTFSRELQIIFENCPKIENCQQPLAICKKILNTL